MYIKFFSFFLALITVVCTLHSQAGGNSAFVMLSPTTYEELSKREQITYVNQVRKIWADFETALPNKTTETFQFHLFDTAYAATTSCTIGGAILQTVQVGKKHFCPTKGRSCGGRADSFQCGEIFVSMCVDRSPPEGISQRCYEASKVKYFKPADYNQMVLNMATAYNEICGSGSKNNANDCRILAERANHVADESTPRYILPSGNSSSSIDYDETVTTNSRKIPARPAHSLSLAEQKSLKQCGFGIDRASKKTYAVPQFSLEKNQFCQYDRNNKLLKELAQNGCRRGNAFPLLFKTTIKAKDKSFLLGDQSSESSGIINAVTQDFQKPNGDAIYVLTMVKANTNITPTAVEEIKLNIRKSGNRYYLIPRNNINAMGTEITINNAVRTSLVLEGVSTTSFQKFMDGKMTLADNCKLANGLKQLPQYASSTSSSSHNSSGSK